MCRQGKERNRISDRIGNRIRDNLNIVFLLINQNVSKLQNILMSLSFKGEKKNEKRKVKMIYSGKKQKHCDTRIHDVNKRKFEIKE